MADGPNNTAELFADDFTKMVLDRLQVQGQMRMQSGYLEIELRLVDTKQRQDGLMNFSILPPRSMRMLLTAYKTPQPPEPPICFEDQVSFSQ